MLLLMRVLACNIQSPLIWFSNPPSKEENKEEQGQERSSDIVNEAAPHPKPTEQDKKKKVQWMDFVGKPLFEIKEYELSSSETEQREWDVQMNKKCCCACVIL